MRDRPIDAETTASHCQFQPPARRKQQPKTHEIEIGSWRQSGDHEYERRVGRIVTARVYLVRDGDDQIAWRAMITGSAPRSTEVVLWRSIPLDRCQEALVEADREILARLQLDKPE